MAAEQFFKKLGMVPYHITIHVDNYLQTSNLFALDGYRNYIYIDKADIIYFNGGDQSRHMRSWFNNDNTPNPIFAVIKRKMSNDQAIILTSM